MKKIAKVFGLLLTGILSLTCLFGCKPSSETENPDGFTVIRFWNGFTGTDGETMDKIVERFNTEYAEEKIMVVADKIPWDTLFTKLTTTSSNLKSAPHIVAMSASRISGMNERNIFLPMDGIEDYLGVTADEYIPAAWNGGVLESYSCISWENGKVKYRGQIKQYDLNDPNCIHEYLPTGLVLYYPLNQNYIVEGQFDDHYNCINNPITLYTLDGALIRQQNADYSMEPDNYNVRYVNF